LVGVLVVVLVGVLVGGTAVYVGVDVGGTAVLVFDAVGVAVRKKPLQPPPHVSSGRLPPVQFPPPVPPHSVSHCS
jgi:hypothetical protein